MKYQPVGALCAKCGMALRPDQPYSWREITAMEQVSRSGGTTSRFRHKQYTGRQFCNECALDIEAQGALPL